MVVQSFENTKHDEKRKKAKCGEDTRNPDLRRIREWWCEEEIETTEEEVRLKISL